MFRILDLKYGDYLRRTLGIGGPIGEVLTFKTRAAAQYKLYNLSAVMRYQKRCKEQFVIEEVPNE